MNALQVITTKQYLKSKRYAIYSPLCGGSGMSKNDCDVPVTTNLTSSLSSNIVSWNSTADCLVVPYTFHFIVAVFIALVSIAAVIGNALVLWTFAKHSTLRTSSNMLVLNLTIADFIMSCVDLPVLATNSFNGCWMMGYVGCQMYGVTSATCALATINTLTAMSFDRYIVVVHRLSPTHQLGKHAMGLVISVIWIMSIFWAVMPLIGVTSYRLEGMGTSCTFDYATRTKTNRWFFLALVTFNFFLPLIIIIYSYWRIHRTVRFVKRELKQLNSNNFTKRRREFQAEWRTAITVLVIITVFCISWTPYVIIAFVGLFGPVTNGVRPLVSMFPNILVKVSTVSNPCLYSVGHPKVRKKISRQIFLWRNNSNPWRNGSGSGQYSNTVIENGATYRKTYL